MKTQVLISPESCLHGAGATLFHQLDEELCAKLDSLRGDLPISNDSYNMSSCSRAFFNSEEIARTIKDAVNNRLPAESGKILKVLSAMRFLSYTTTGQIAPHTDGKMYDEELSRSSTHTFLLYLNDVTDGSGETKFLAGANWSWGKREMDEAERAKWGRSNDDNEVKVLCGVTPQRNSLLMFPHNAPHVGDPVWDRKILLRGDMILDSF